MMLGEVSKNRSGLFILALYVGAPVLLLGGMVVYLVLGGPGAVVKVDPLPSDQKDTQLAEARAILNKQTDLLSCKAVLPLLNAHLKKSKEPPPALSETASAMLRTQLGLSADDLAEVASESFTGLDAYHLESCLLLREAARGLELATPGGRGSTVKQTPMERAELAFAWVMRQVSLPQFQENVKRPPEGAPVPPPFALRRGWGTPLERALAFLALLEQFGQDDDTSGVLRGALVYCPDKEGKKRLWACGVTIGEKRESIFLFDPRMGLPIPGPDGKGVATLAQVRDDPKVLGQLQIDKLSYDVTPAQARDAEVILYCPLSALAPRMLLLQDRLLRDRSWNDQPLPAPLRVHLAEDISTALGDLRTAMKNSGDNPERVRPWGAGATIMRRFLPKEDGGSDASQTALRVYLQSIVPWFDFPADFLDERLFQPDKGLGLDLRKMFAVPFFKTVLETRSPRERIIRGHPDDQAARELVDDQQYWQLMRRRRNEAVQLNKGVGEWINQAIAVYANELREHGGPNEAQAKAEVAALWQWRPDDPMSVMLLGAAAEGRSADATYQLGLCKHEVAARLQARKELAARGKVERPEDSVRAAAAWKDAESYWKEFLDTYPNRNGRNASLLRQAEAQQMRGEIDEAVRTLSIVPPALTDLEKLARWWLARQLTARKGSKP